MTVELAGVGWRFWLLWVMATGVGLAGGFGLGWTVGYVLGGPLAVAVGKGVVWPTVGIMQWLVLRRRVSGAAGWIGAYVAAGVVVGAFGFAVGWSLGDVPAVVGGVFLGVMVGTVAGILQWRVLRRQFSGTGWWLLASTLGWVIGLAIGFGLVHAVDLAGPDGGVGPLAQSVAGAAAGLGAGATTGIILVRLLRQPHEVA